MKDFRMDRDDESKTKQSESSMMEVKKLIDEIDLEPNCKEIF